MAGIMAFFALVAAAQGASGTSQVSSLQRAIDRGKTMYLYDRAAWVTSDDAALAFQRLDRRRSEAGS